jgi:hypothetical protein
MYDKIVLTANMQKYFVKFNNGMILTHGAPLLTTYPEA